MCFCAEGSRVYFSISFLGIPLKVGNECSPIIGSSDIVRPASLLTTLFPCLSVLSNVLLNGPASVR